MAALLISISLIPLIYEDFKYRAIHWLWIAALLFLVIFYFSFRVEAVLVNLFFISIQLIGISLYFSLKKRRFINIIDRYLGIGDIVFFIPLIFLFSPINFLIFFITSIFLTLIVFLVLQSNNLIQQATIPLAGCLSLFLLVLIPLSQIYGFDLQNDLWFLTILNNWTKLYTIHFFEISQNFQHILLAVKSL